MHLLTFVLEMGYFLSQIPLCDEKCTPDAQSPV